MLKIHMSAHGTPLVDQCSSMESEEANQDNDRGMCDSMADEKE
jgi:hypothetical protein